MKKHIITLIIGFIISANLFAQEEKLLAIGAFDPFGVENENASKILTNNIIRALNLNGLAATDSRFMVISNVAELSKRTTATAPVKHIIELDVTMFMVDLYTNVSFSQAEFVVKGVGNNEAQAYINAIRTIQARNSKFKTMIVKGKEKIIDYYTQNGEQILGRIKAHIERKDYKSAIIETYAIPEAMIELYNQASELLAQIPNIEEKKAEVTTISLHNYFYTEPSRERAAKFITIN